MINRALSASLAALLVVSGCHEHTTSAEKATQNETLSFEKMLAEKFSDENQASVREGLEALSEGNYKLASQRFNVALIKDPSNAFLHYINGLAYHSLARQGDVTKFELARAGFEQSLKFNPSNHLAALQLARVYLDEKKYADAQEEYAGVLLLKPDDAEALYEMANASYYMGDLKNAQMAINRALIKLGNRAEVRKTAVMIYAAAGKHDKAREQFEIYKKLDPKPSNQQQTFERTQDWRKLYEKGIVLAQADPSATQSEFAAATPDVIPDASASGGGDSASASPAAPSKEGSSIPGEGTMIVVDAVTLRVSETGNTSKGNNILDKFSVTVSPGSHTYTRGNAGGSTTASAYIFKPDGSIDSAGTFAAQGTLGATRLFAQGLTFGAIQYSLNIANASQEYIEVIGRPSLVTTVGSPDGAKFFSGNHLALGLAPQSGGSAGSIQQIPVGVTLEVNALSLKNDIVVLDVIIYGSIVNENDLFSVNGSAIDPTSQFTRIGLSKIKTRVKVRLGETVMLAGVAERTDSQNKSGVPGLQDIPLVQYFFSRETTSSVHKSVVYMLTPRSYEANKRAIMTMVNQPSKKQPNMKELQIRNTDWYDPSYNMVVAFNYLTPLQREFRQTDLAPLNWDMKSRYEDKVRQAASFLYF